MREEMESLDYISTRIITRNGVQSYSKLCSTENDPEDGKMSKQMQKVPNNPPVLRDITNRLGEEEGKTKCRNSKWKNEVARERWQILAKALLKSEKIPRKGCKAKDISVRRFATFDLIAPSILEKLEAIDACWLKYTSKHLLKVYLIEILHLEPRLSPRELIGFNNTGNICIWPSEEVLTHYVLSNIHAFGGKDVLEVGGGMTCLAGIMLAKYGNVRKIDLTDGNLISVENVNKIITRNKLDRMKVASFRLDWVNHRRLTVQYDVVLSSDCLFFDETRGDLVETIWNSLKDDGVALVMAPKRGNTLDHFIKLVAKRGFHWLLLTYYDETVWKQHLKFKEFVQEYEEDLHYPVLLLLTKTNQGFPISPFLSVTY